MNESFLQNIFDRPENEMAERLVGAASMYPQAFKILPISMHPDEQGTWAKYEFDGTVNLWVDSSHHVAIDMYKEIFTEKKERTVAQELTVVEKDTIKSLIWKNLKAISSVLPKHLTPERMFGVSYTAIVKNPTLARCTQLSLVNGVIGASVIGLEIGEPLNLAHLVPFKNGKTGQYEATLMIDYKGFYELMYKSPLVKSISSQAVYSNEEFTYTRGTNPSIHHGELVAEKGDLIGAYCIVFFMNGGFDFEVVNKEIAMEAKEHSPAKNKKDSPWNTSDEWTMWVKTAVRRIAKRVPKSPELQKALAVEAAFESGEENPIKDIVDVDFETIIDDTQVLEEKLEEEQQSVIPIVSENLLQKVDVETQKLYTNYQMFIENMPEEAKATAIDLALEPGAEITPEIALKMIKGINASLDGNL